MKQRHANSKKLYNYYKKNVSEDISYSSFLSNETPLKDKIISYDVSFQLTYRGQRDIVESNPVTFRVYGVIGSEREIEDRTMQMILDSKGGITNDNFNPQLLEKLEKNGIRTKVTPRGMEKNYSPKTRDKVLELVNSGTFYVEELDKSFKFRNKKKRVGEMSINDDVFKY